MKAERQISLWHQQKFPNSDLYKKAVKLGEEVGEVLGAITKRDEGRATTKDILDEVGDVLVVLSVIVDNVAPNVTLDSLRAQKFREVRLRNWGPTAGEGEFPA